MEAEEAPAYDIDDAAADLFVPVAAVETMVGLARHRRNIILQGPPGVGKTFIADRLASVLIGHEGGEQRVAVQFHPSYAYEDFVQGWRPAAGGGFELKDGPFLELCDRALQDPDGTYVLLVDEINRGNLGKVFGELMMLLEADKRSPRWALRLTYATDGRRFHVPPNVIVIGTMNTADRSLALVDYALRRRFAFVEVAPGLEEPGFEAFLVSRGATAALVARIRARVGRVNRLIEDDDALGRGFCIGHSYFCSAAGAFDDEWLERVVEYELAPLLREYWFDREDRAKEAIALLVGEA